LLKDVGCEDFFIRIMYVDQSLADRKAHGCYEINARHKIVVAVEYLVPTLP
jgi:hypothetical protein